MTPLDASTRALIVEMRDRLLESLYGETKYSRYGHDLAVTIRKADIALGIAHYTDLRKRYPGPRRRTGAKRRIA